jgi:hypothetical protein
VGGYGNLKKRSVQINYYGNSGRPMKTRKISKTLDTRIPKKRKEENGKQELNRIRKKKYPMKESFGC